MKKQAASTTNREIVEEYMQQLQHPLKAEIEALRTIIKGADARINERIKWAAPSYYFKEDLVTFNHRATKHVHLVFHHLAIVDITSPLLEGDYKDRRMAYFPDMKAVNANKKELEKIMQELVRRIEK
jgi:hypothetical protein